MIYLHNHNHNRVTSYDLLLFIFYGALERFWCFNIVPYKKIQSTSFLSPSLSFGFPWSAIWNLLYFDLRSSKTITTKGVSANQNVDLMEYFDTSHVKHTRKNARHYPLLRDFENKRPGKVKRGLIFFDVLQIGKFLCPPHRMYRKIRTHS